MGFFDDLERKLPDPIDPDAPLDESLFGPALNKLEGGWVFGTILVEGDPREREQLDEAVEIRFTGGRYLYITRLQEKKGTRNTVVRSESSRKLDREGMIELLQDQRRIARKLVEAAGGRMPGDVPRR
jgi:hypothetical protein